MCFRLCKGQENHIKYNKIFHLETCQTITSQKIGFATGEIYFRSQWFSSALVGICTAQRPLFHASQFHFHVQSIEVIWERDPHVHVYPYIQDWRNIHRAYESGAPGEHGQYPDGTVPRVNWMIILLYLVLY